VSRTIQTSNLWVYPGETHAFMIPGASSALGFVYDETPREMLCSALRLHRRARE